MPSAEIEEISSISQIAINKQYTHPTKATQCVGRHNIYTMIRNYTSQIKSTVLASCLALLACSVACGNRQQRPITARISPNPRTFCNPINIDYRFMLIHGGEGLREAADPVVIPFKDDYYLFASKSSGYWHTRNFVDWSYVAIADSILPIEIYAPAILVDGDSMYYAPSAHGTVQLYSSDDPRTGRWRPSRRVFSGWDPGFYKEGDTLYAYHNSSPVEPIRVEVTEWSTGRRLMDSTIVCFNSDQLNHGWERPGEDHNLPRRPYIEGPWMTKYGDRYYLQYSAPGTEWKSYGDGVYTAPTPFGPFTYAPNNPFCYKPTGFMGGSGHGSTFVDTAGNYWRAVTSSISVGHMFERRLVMFPAGFDADSIMYTNTYLGDYPLYLPGSHERSIHPDWVLLSGNCPVTVSSSIDSLPPSNAVDEDSRTYWAALSADSTEWFSIDLRQKSYIQAVQVNFAEHGSGHRGRTEGSYQNYELLASHDGKQWSQIALRSDSRDRPHDYIEFEFPFAAQYIKIRNRDFTCGTNFSLRGLRVFGRGSGPRPDKVEYATSMRSASDPCSAMISWPPSSKTSGYIVRYGTARDKLYNSYQVADSTKLSIPSLNNGVEYWFTIDSYNENGVTRGAKAWMVEYEKK